MALPLQVCKSRKDEARGSQLGLLRSWIYIMIQGPHQGTASSKLEFHHLDSLKAWNSN
jgi:hypothetical protein